MEQTENLTRRQKLIVAVQAGHEALVGFVRGLGAAERELAEPRLLAAHLAAHKLRTARAVMAWRLGGAVDLPGEAEEQAEDERGFAAASWQEAADLMLQAQRQALELILALEEAELEQAGTAAWMGRRPLWRVLYAGCLGYPASRLAGYWLAHGRAEAAGRLRQQELQMALGLDDAPAWQGAAHYNLACHHALAGSSGAALGELSLAFELSPELAGYSHNDPDLAGLQGEAGYAALVEQAQRRLREGAALDRARLEGVLGKVLERLSRGGRRVDFRLVGTAAALLHGVKLPAADVDLLARDRRGVETIAAALEGFPCTQPPQHLEAAMQYFAEFRVDGVAVQISTVEVEEETDTLECVGGGPWVHFSELRCRGQRVPAVALELRLLSELRRGRDDRVAPLLDFMQEKGCDLALLRRGMREAQIAEAQQLRVMKRLLGG